MHKTCQLQDHPGSTCLTGELDGCLSVNANEWPLLPGHRGQAVFDRLLVGHVEGLRVPWTVECWCTQMQVLREDLREGGPFRREAWIAPFYFFHLKIE